MTVKDISMTLGLREKEVIEHLPHVEKSIGKRVSIIVEPPECLRCGFVFKKRNRFTTPSRCPECKSESVSAPILGIRGETSGET